MRRFRFGERFRICEKKGHAPLQPAKKVLAIHTQNTVLYGYWHAYKTCNMRFSVGVGECKIDIVAMLNMYLKKWLFFFFTSYLILSVLLVNVFLDEVQKCTIFGLETAMWVRLFWAPRWRHRYFHTVHSIQVTHKARYFGLKKKKNGFYSFIKLAHSEKRNEWTNVVKYTKCIPVHEKWRSTQIWNLLNQFSKGEGPKTDPGDALWHPRLTRKEPQKAWLDQPFIISGATALIINLVQIPWFCKGTYFYKDPKPNSNNCGEVFMLSRVVSLLSPQQPGLAKRGRERQRITVHKVANWKIKRN